MPPAPTCGDLRRMVPPSVSDQPSGSPSQPPVAPTGRRLEQKPRRNRLPAATQPTSAQPIYASGAPPVAPLQPRQSFFGWAGFKLPAEPLASSQLPPATFPASYQLSAPAAPQPNRVSPTPQGNIAANPPAPNFGGWKPVLIPALIRKIKSWGSGCGCQGCHRRRCAPLVAKLALCCGAKDPAVSPSPQANFGGDVVQGPAASKPNAASLSSSARSSGTEPGDVAEGGKVFESTAFESRDKSP